MKIYTPELSWHDCQAIFALDIDPLFQENGSFAFATGGLDSYIRIWLSKYQINDINIQFIGELQRHQKSINALRYSPNGKYIASGDDDGAILLWERMHQQYSQDFSHLSSWSVSKILRYHSQDICDISWSPDSCYLLSGAQDKLCIKWDVEKGVYIQIYKEHKNFVQGVCWDPLNRYIVSLSRDRTCRIINHISNNIVYNIKKRLINLNLSFKQDKKGSVSHLFQDENLTSFFRRLSFSPDGNLLLVPAGCIENNSDFLPVSYIFGRNKLNEPIACLPALDKYSNIVAFCPLFFQKHNNDSSLFNLPYKMVFAISSNTHVAIYDTEQLSPIFMVNNLHYWWISDMRWCHDGKTLIISSTDGYVSLLQFQEFELGQTYINNNNNNNSETETIKSLIINQRNLNSVDGQSSVLVVENEYKVKDNIDVPSNFMDVENHENIKEETTKIINLGALKVQNDIPMSSCSTSNLTEWNVSNTSQTNGNVGKRRIPFITLDKK